MIARGGSTSAQTTPDAPDAPDATDTAEPYDLLIVGYGPAGAALANLLGRRGWRIAILDSATTIYDKPRAITADQEVLRIFQECGLAEEIYRTSAPHPGTDYVGIEGQVIKRFYPAPPPEPLAWEPAWMFVQPQLEAQLRAGVARYPRVTELLGHEFLRYEQDDELVHAQVRRLKDGRQMRLSARWLVGADGGRSTVRRQCGTAIEDLAFDEWWVVVDAWLRGPVDLPPRCIQYCRPSRPGTYIVGPGDLRRWEIKLLPGERPEDFASPEAVLRALSTFVETKNLELCRSATYRFHALVVERWRFDRVFLMGDAAHQTPPFLGQGLCAAIRDAFNLAWKLDAVRNQGWDPALLDSYAQERKPHVRTVVAHAKSFGLIIGELDVEAARIRDRELGELLASGKAETVRQRFIPGLEAGLIAHGDDGARLPGAGDLFVQPWVRQSGDWTRFDELLPPVFAIVAGRAEALGWLDGESTGLWSRLRGRRALVGDAGAVRADPADHAGGTHRADGDLIRVEERDGLFANWLRALGAAVVIVRPDRYVYGIAADAATLNRLVRQLAARLVAQTQRAPGP